MTRDELIERLLLLPDLDAQRRCLEECRPLLDDALAEALKLRADQALRADCRRSLLISFLLECMGEVSGDPCHRALGLRAEGNCRCLGGLGEYRRAIELYDEAAEIYRAAGQPLQQAGSQIGKIYALAYLGRYADALETGRRIGAVLEAHGRWRQIADLSLNLGVMLGRTGEDAQSLSMLYHAREFYLRAGPEAEPAVPWVDNNLAIVLRNLGRFEESIEASHRAREALVRGGQQAEASRALQTLARTYSIQGRYNEALAILDEVREVMTRCGRPRDAMVADLYISDILLQLRRSEAVLETCRRIRDQFFSLGSRFEVGETMLNEAVAYAGLGRTGEAMHSLDEARAVFIEEGNEAWIAGADLERASLFLFSGRFEEALAAAEACRAVFEAHDLPVRLAAALLIVSRANLCLGRPAEARLHAEIACDLVESRALSPLAYTCHHLLGILAEAGGQPAAALIEYNRAIQELERLRGRLMIEFRAGFLEDKQSAYQAAVRLCLQGGRVSEALAYAERAKSRSLLELLSFRLDLGLRARRPADRPLVEELARLRSERDRLYRRWEGREEAAREAWAAGIEERQRVRGEILALEKQIADGWHRLLVRNADYARDASLWQVRAEPVQPYLAPDTALLEYFEADGELFAFLVTPSAIEAHCLAGAAEEIDRLIRLLWLNLRAVPVAIPGQARALEANARGLLRRLYTLLMAPLAQALAAYPRLIVVPHGALHYLPFQALHDGEGWLLERLEVSYLPSASLLRYCQRVGLPTGGVLVLGHSNAGRLPFAVQEARMVAGSLSGEAYLEKKATPARFRRLAPRARVVHLAAHGEFRPDEPLFSGVTLERGRLSTLDLFGMRLKASLVTLSACETGQNVLGGGDELLGLARALLYAGASSLVLSLWTVEDRSTALLMETFYAGLARGRPKGAALRDAQLRLRQEDPAFAHPFFWAPFCLVGDAGPL